MKNILVRSVVIILACVLLAWSAPAMADEQGWYGGAGIGQSTNQDIDVNLPPPAPYEWDDTDIGWKVFIGHWLNNAFGYEIMYTDFGEATLSVPALGDATVDGQALSLLFIASAPIMDGLSVHGKLGLSGWKGKINVTGVSPLYEKDRGIDPVFGVGVQYGLTDIIKVRAEYERHTEFGDTIDADLASVSVLYEF